MFLAGSKKPPQMLALRNLEEVMCIFKRIILGSGRKGIKKACLVGGKLSCDTRWSGRRKKMKKILVLTLICVLVLPLMAVQPVSAGGKGLQIIRCDQLITSGVSSAADWVGTLSGCAIAGDVFYWEMPGQDYVTGAKGGKIEHYFETFLITTPTGTIEGVESGVYHLYSNFLFQAEGRVTSATGQWTYLVGYKFHELGNTNDPLAPDVQALYGPSTMFLAP
jgi:hypothetical protein